MAAALGKATFCVWPIFSRWGETDSGIAMDKSWENKWITHDNSQSGSTNHEKLRKWNVPNSKNLVLFTRSVRLGAKSYAKLDSNFQNTAGFWALL